MVPQSAGRMLRPPVSPMLTILASVATWECEIALERQPEGIVKAKADGRYEGRPPYIDRARRPWQVTASIYLIQINARGAGRR
jgi:DNA invertase Pin-like site-specific DNA recombinase